MTLDFEARLRHDLLESAGPADDVALDIDAAIAVGRRTRRRRNLGWGAALAVSGLVAGASLASTVNGGWVDRSGVVARPVPAVTTPALPSVTFAMDGRGTATRPWSTHDPRSITVAVTPHQDGRFTVDYTTVTQEGEHVAATADVASGVAGWTTQTAWGYVVGVVPGAAQVVIPIPTTAEGDPIPHGTATSELRPLGDSGLSAFYVRLDIAQEAAFDRQLIWVDGAGVHSSATKTVASARLQSGEIQLTAFVDRTIGVFGTVDQGKPDWRAIRTEPGAETLLESGDSSSSRRYVAGLFPAGATDVRVSFGAGVVDQNLVLDKTADPDGAIFFLATGSGGGDHLLRTVSWTAPNGRRVVVDATW